MANVIAANPPKVYSPLEKKYTKITTNKAINRLYVSGTNKCPMKFQNRDILLCGYLGKYQVAFRPSLDVTGDFNRQSQQ